MAFRIQRSVVVMLILTAAVIAVAIIVWVKPRKSDPLERALRGVTLADHSGFASAETAGEVSWRVLAESRVQKIFADPSRTFLTRWAAVSTDGTALGVPRIACGLVDTQSSSGASTGDKMYVVYQDPADKERLCHETAFTGACSDVTVTPLFAACVARMTSSGTKSARDQPPSGDGPNTAAETKSIERVRAEVIERDQLAAAAAAATKAQEAELRRVAELGRAVTATQFGNEWPLTIPEAYLDCVEPGRAIVRTPTGETYGLTRFAAQTLNIPDATPIRKRDPKYPEIFVSSLPLVRIALERCPSERRK